MEKSIITNNLDECFLCKARPVEIHHVIYGMANRRLSDKYKLVIPLCRKHHTDGKHAVHNNIETDLSLKAIAQKSFVKAYPELDFRQIFGRNYIDEKEK